MRIFISHSSKDKTCYCNDVVNRLVEKVGKDSIIYPASLNPALLIKMSTESLASVTCSKIFFSTLASDKL